MPLSKEDTLVVAKAAGELPMAWLAQPDFPDRALVRQAFRNAGQMLPGWTPGEPHELTSVRSALTGIAAGPDLRAGTFKAQAVRVAAQLHDYAVKLLMELTSK